MSDVTVSFTADEQATLIRILEVALGESRVEVRHTHSSPSFRDQVLAEENQIATLLKKVRGPASS